MPLKSIVICSARMLSAAAISAVLFGCSAEEEPKPHHIIEVAAAPELILLTKAVESYDRGLYTISGEAWRELRDSYPTGYYGTLAEIKSADCHFYSRNFSEALVAYEEFIRLHRGHSALPYVYYQIANSHWMQYKDELHDQGPLLTAIQEFRKVISEFPESEYAERAKARLAEAENEIVEHEAAVAAFYLKIGEYDSALARIRTIEEKYPLSNAAKDLREKFARFFEEEYDEIPRRVRREYRRLPLKVAMADSPIPDAPSLLLAELPETTARAQLKMNADFSDSSEVQAKEPSQPPGLIRSSSCEEFGDGLAFVVSVREQLNAGSLIRSDASVSGAATSSTAASKVRPTNSASCTVGGVDFRAQESLSAGQAAIELQATGIGSREATLLSLDRPNRLLLIVER